MRLLHTCQPTEYKNLETSKKSWHCMNVIFNNVWIFSENHPKIFRMLPTTILDSTDVNNVRKPRQLSTTCCAIWLVASWPTMILLNYLSILRITIENSSRSALNPLLVYFPLWHLENNEFNEKLLQKAALCISREIWCFNLEIWWKTWRLRENRES